MYEEKNEVSVRVYLYAESKCNYSHFKDEKICISVTPYSAPSEQLKPLAVKVCYQIEDAIGFLLERDKKDAIARFKAYNYGVINRRLWIVTVLLCIVLLISMIVNLK